MQQVISKTVPEIFEYVRERFLRIDEFVIQTVKDSYFSDFDKDVKVVFLGKDVGLIESETRPKDEKITAAVDVGEVGKNQVAYLTRPTWLKNIEEHPHLKEASCLIVTPDMVEPAKKAGLDCHLIISAYPKIVFVEILELAHQKTVIQQTKEDYQNPGEPELGEGAFVHPAAVTGRNVKIGAGTFIGPNCFIGSDVEIGDNCMVFPNVSIMAEAKIGKKVILQSGVVIGSDGFGYTQVGYKLQVDEALAKEISAKTTHPEIMAEWPVHGFVNYKHPHFGPAIIGDDVELGANGVVDRGQHLPTRVGNNTKADKAVYIAHNDQVGTSCIFCGQTAIGGNCKIGSQVMSAAKVGMRDNTTIGDRVLIEAMSGVGFDLPDGRKTYAGRPAVPSKVHWRSQKIQHEHLETHHKVVRLVMRLLDQAPIIDPDDISDADILAFIRNMLPSVNKFKKRMKSVKDDK